MKEIQAIQRLQELIKVESFWQKNEDFLNYINSVKAYGLSENWLSFVSLVSEIEATFSMAMQNVNLQTQKIQDTLSFIIDYLPKCIHLLKSGCEDNPVFFAPLLNDLRAILHEPFFSENTLYFPTIHTPLMIERITRQQRFNFQQGLLALQYKQHKSSAWDYMIESIDSLRMSCSTKDHADLWDVTYVFLMLLKEELLPETYAIDLVLREIDHFLKMQVEIVVGEEQQRHDAAYHLIYQMLYYISITNDNNHITKSFEDHFGLKDAVYLLRLPNEVDAAVIAINQELRQKLENKIELLCHECKLLMTTLPLPSAQIISQLKRLRDCLLSSQQFAIANDVSVLISQGIDGLQPMLLAELCDRMVDHRPQQIVIQSKQEYNQIEILMESLASILSVLSHIVESPSSSDLYKLEESFSSLADNSYSLPYPDIHILATDISILLQEIINHEITQPADLLSLIDESCDLIPELIECISLHQNPQGITTKMIEKISMCRADKLSIKKPDLFVSEVDHYFLQELREVVSEFSVKHLLAQKLMERVTTKLQSCYAKDHLESITELALQTQQILDTEWQLHKVIQQKLGAVLVVPYEQYINELMTKMEALALADGIFLNFEFHTDGEMIERTKAPTLNELLILIYQDHITRMKKEDSIGLQLTCAKDIQGTIFTLKISTFIDTLTDKINIQVRRRLHRLCAVMKMMHDDESSSIYTLTIPITSLTTYASIVKLGDDNYALPTQDIDALIKLDEMNVDTRLVEKITHNGHTYRLFHLHTLLGRPVKREVSLHNASHQQIFFCYQVNGQSCAVYVDTFVHNEEIVIKPLSTLLQRLPGILGATLFQDQSLALVLDVPCLIGEYLLRQEIGNSADVHASIEWSYGR